MDDESAGGPGPSTEGAAWTVLGYLITGPAVYGALGWLLDEWLGTEFLLPVGVIGGMALAIYVVILRYGTR
jgi:F0F1-type ATP synthase assembly protein I